MVFRSLELAGLSIWPTSFPKERCPKRTIECLCASDAQSKEHLVAFLHAVLGRFAGVGQASRDHVGLPILLARHHLGLAQALALHSHAEERQLQRMLRDLRGLRCDEGRELKHAVQ